MLSLGKDGTHMSAVATHVTARVPPLGVGGIAIVTLPANPFARFPNASLAVTWTAGVMALVAFVVEGCTVKLSEAAAAGVTVTVAVCVASRPATVANTTFGPVAVALIDPVATPFASVGPPGCVRVKPVPVAESTTVAPGTGSPNASSAVTVMVAELDPVLAVMVVGAATTVEAADTLPGSTVNGGGVSPVSPDADVTRVYPLPLLETVRSEKVAIPLAAVTGNVPDSVPPAGCAPSDTVTLPTYPVATLPNVSLALT